MKRKCQKCRIWFVLITVIVLLSAAFCYQTHAATPVKTLKIGIIAWLGWPVGLDMVNGIKVWGDVDNAKGGLDIEGTKYKIEFIVYDSNNDQATAVSAANRLIFQDKVDFILGEFGVVDPYLPITEENKVIVVASSVTPPIISPDKHYCFQAGSMNAPTVVQWTWFTKAYPEKKFVIGAYPDNMMGHGVSEFGLGVLSRFGIRIENIFYPPESQDLSAIGTKVKNLNPDVFAPTGGGPVLDSLCIKAAWQSGYKGTIFSASTWTAFIMAQVIPTEALEGIMCEALPTEFDPALTPMAQKFKEAYAAKYGKWNYPEIRIMSVWPALRAALQEAGSLDTDKVADVLANGLKYESPTGTFQMVSRPDVGNNRTVDSVQSYIIKKIVKGKPELLHQIPLEESVKAFKDFYYK